MDSCLRRNDKNIGGTLPSDLCLLSPAPSLVPLLGGVTFSLALRAIFNMAEQSPPRCPFLFSEDRW